MNKLYDDLITGCMAPGEWYTVLELHPRVTALAVSRNAWGPVSMIIALFSRERAASWLELFSFGDTYAHVFKLSEQKNCSHVRETSEWLKGSCSVLLSTPYHKK